MRNQQLGPNSDNSGQNFKNSLKFDSNEYKNYEYLTYEKIDFKKEFLTDVNFLKYDFTDRYNLQEDYW